VLYSHDWLVIGVKNTYLYSKRLFLCPILFFLSDGLADGTPSLGGKTLESVVGDFQLSRVQIIILIPIVDTVKRYLGV
jgi:hypothetical protein